jgi:RNA polymerase sigma factor (sigma-70 family)
MNPLTTSFVRRLRERDESAWFELWEVFGPVIRHQLHRWGRGSVGAETVRDLTQETLAALSGAIDRYDPARGARFSTWLLSIAKHVLGDELDRRNAQKRGSGRRPVALDEAYMGEWGGAGADELYEQNVFQAKVYAAIRAAESDCDFLHFQVYRMRVLDGIQGKDVSSQLGISAPTVTRHLQRVRNLLREQLATIVATYSFTADERREADEAGLVGDDGLFDEAIADIWHRQVELVREDDLRATHG